MGLNSLSFTEWYKEVYDDRNGKDFENCQLPPNLRTPGMIRKAHFKGYIRKINTNVQSKIATWKFVKEL